MKEKVIELENGLRQVTTYFEDGKTPEGVCTIDKDGIYQGPYESYYGDGQLWEKCTYKDDENDGLYKSYYRNGQLKCKCTYKDGKLDGPYEEYYEDGRLREKCTYKDGKLDGLYEEYGKNGQLKKRCIYKDNEIIENKLNPDRKGLNKLLQSLDKNRKPTTERRTTKRMIVEEYRREHPKNGGR